MFEVYCRWRIDKTRWSYSAHRGGGRAVAYTGLVSAAMYDRSYMHAAASCPLVAIEILSPSLSLLWYYVASCIHSLKAYLQLASENCISLYVGLAEWYASARFGTGVVYTVEYRNRV